MAKKLKSGFTTGTAAAAAVKGALLTLLLGKPPEAVEIRFLSEGSITIPLHTCKREGEQTVACTVIKDAGDDPDVTHRAEIGARVELAGAVSELEPRNGLPDPLFRLRGGMGVGQVTKPGLDLPLGEPAINPGPRTMIRNSIQEAFRASGRSCPLEIEIFVPKGAEIARKTLNARLGILGGISILGTTGIVRPMSHGAYQATIEAALSVAKAAGAGQVVLTTGRRSERLAQARWTQWPAESFIQIGDYFRFSMETAAKLKLPRVVLAVFFGKALKMAQGVPHTHAAKSRLTLERLGQWTWEITGDAQLADEVGQGNTARHALEMLWPEHPAVIRKVGNRMVASARAFAGCPLNVWGVIWGFDGKLVFNSDPDSL